MPEMNECKCLRYQKFMRAQLLGLILVVIAGALMVGALAALDYRAISLCILIVTIVGAGLLMRELNRTLQQLRHHFGFSNA